MIRWMLAVLAVVALDSVALFATEDEPAAKEVKRPAYLYPEFEADQKLLRQLLIHKAKDGGKDTKASSGEACAAAERIFSRVAFLFRTRAEVLELLGDPATISDYNDPASAEPMSPLVYVFDSGFGGWKYTLTFGRLDQVRVVQVQVEGQD
jgi:hypothetical protein